MKQHIHTDIVIIGGGIMGLAVGKEILDRHPKLKVTILEKEPALACHASGRNSGVIHAGFYYTPDSLKARFTADGNSLMTDYCLRHGLLINRCGKVIVAKNDKELDTLHELKTRGDANGVVLQIVDEKGLERLEPNARTYKEALYSPSTSTVDPREVVGHIAAGLKGKADLLLNEEFQKRDDERTISTTHLRIHYKYAVNAAGLYADTVAHRFGAGLKYTLVPFKGLYVTYTDNTVIGRHIYPVPDIHNPFLGVHFTKAADGGVKIGPTAIPSLWRENYGGASRFRLREFLEVMYYESRMFIGNPANFRHLVYEEIKKYSIRHLTRQASALVKHIDRDKFGRPAEPGIRAQLVDRTTMALVMDFIVEHGDQSTHVLNAVSPAFTSSLSFSRYIADECEKRSASLF